MWVFTIRRCRRCQITSFSLRFVCPFAPRRVFLFPVYPVVLLCLSSPIPPVSRSPGDLAHDCRCSERTLHRAVTYETMCREPVLVFRCRGEVMRVSSRNFVRQPELIFWRRVGTFPSVFKTPNATKKSVLARVWMCLPSLVLPPPPPLRCRTPLQIAPPFKNLAGEPRGKTRGFVVAPSIAGSGRPQCGSPSTSRPFALCAIYSSIGLSIYLSISVSLALRKSRRVQCPGFGAMRDLWAASRVNE